MAGLALAGCSSPLLQNYHYAGVGDFEEVSMTIPGKIIPGYEISLPAFSLSSACEAEHRLGRLPIIPNTGIFISIAVEYRDPSEMRALGFRTIRREAGLPHAPAPWRGSMQVTLTDARGRTIWETNERIEDMWSSPGQARRAWLGSGQRVWEIPREADTEFTLRIDYRPDPGYPQLARSARLIIRAGGSI
jgi:hypothetical protein